MIFGLILVAIGIIFLLQNLNIITGRAWEIIWPVVVILIGIGFGVRHVKGKGCCGEDRKKMFKQKMRGPMNTHEGEE